MSVTVQVTITTKEGCFDDFYALAKNKLEFTRGFDGCHAVYTSSSKATNNLKFI